MTVKERILAIRLMEKQERNPDYLKRLGVQVRMIEKNQGEKENKNV